MATTANRAYRYPAGTDPVRVPLDVQHLADDVDADVMTLGASTAYTPGLTNITLGAGGTNHGWYTKLPGGWINGAFYLVFGTSPSIAATCDIGLPEAAWQPIASVIQICVGSWTFRDQSPSIYHYGGALGIWAPAADSVSMNGAWDGTAPRLRMTNAIPFTVAATDILSGQFSYRAAA